MFATTLISRPTSRSSRRISGSLLRMSRRSITSQPSRSGLHWMLRWPGRALLRLRVTRLSLTVALAPRVVIFHAEADKGRAVLMHKGLAKFEQQRISRIQRNIHLTAQDEILLSIILIDAVDERGAPPGVARIKRSPEAVA